MAFFAAFAVLLFAGACHGGSRIVGGTPTTIERYPYIVQVDFWDTRFSTWSQSCGANILNELYVLSAAHCFESTYNNPYHPSFRRIRAGTTYRHIGGVLINIVREFNHPDYNVATSLDSDISVIRLASFTSFTPVIQPVRLLSSNSVVPDNSPVVHAGWGITAEGSFSPVLLKTQIYTINLEECRRRYATYDDEDLTPNMICAGLLDVGGRDACQGDSGGPLYFDDTNILVGIVSWGADCGDPFLPGVSAAVSPFIDWILSIVG